MNLLRTRTFILLFTAALSCGHAFGWGCDGHRIVALIAEHHLSPAARAAVDELLKSNPIDPALSRYCQPIAPDPMADTATWADDTRRDEKTSTWHYLDIPWGVEHPDLMKYCEPVGDSVNGKERPGCLLTGLQYEFDILKDRNRPPAERAKALRYVIHFIGDLHQPLHTTANDDQGGNCTSVLLFDDPKPTNLHSAWDTGILVHDLKQHNETYGQAAAKIDEQFHQQGQSWLRDRIDFGKWILEGHRVAEKITYSRLRPKLPRAPLQNPPGCAAEREKTTALKIDIDARYAAEAMPVIDRQLAKAGYRLADVLNAAF